MARCAVFVVVFLAAVVSESAAQGLRCVSIREGDSVAEAARRLTGDARSRFEPWFQIVDPASSRLVPKARYDHVLPGWRACIAEESVTQMARQTAVEAGAGQDLVLWVALVIAFVLLSSGVGDYRASRVPDDMRRFGEAFVREFERPLLVRGDVVRVVRAQLRANAHRRRLEVLLAPGQGRRYPNLSDHRKNLEYDITRVVRRVRAPSVAVGTPYAQGPWVVVPFQFPDGVEQAGGK